LKYRHVFHAGNFADVHKHVTVLALLEALQRKPGGLLYLDTHAGAGLYRLQSTLARRTRESASGIGRLLGRAPAAPELINYLARVSEVRAPGSDLELYPGSPVLAARQLRAQDRLAAVESDPIEAATLMESLRGEARAHVERGDGFARLRAWLPPPERRGLVLLDPPYEDSAQDFRHLQQALIEGLRRFETGVFCAWYPIKDLRDTDRWRAALTARLGRETLCAELWLHPTDSTAGLNGSGLLIVNPPWQIGDRMRAWLPELEALLRVGSAGGSRVLGSHAAAEA
jgi:23S rRNA (adenine2030-N6)-methyltransferase